MLKQADLSSGIWGQSGRRWQRSPVIVKYIMIHFHHIILICKLCDQYTGSTAHFRDCKALDSRRWRIFGLNDLKRYGHKNIRQNFGANQKHWNRSMVLGLSRDNKPTVYPYCRKSMSLFGVTPPLRRKK